MKQELGTRQELSVILRRSRRSSHGCARIRAGSLASLGMTLAILASILILNFTLYTPVVQADCIAGASCPQGQVQAEGPCPTQGQINCIPAPSPPPAGGAATPTAVELPNPLGTVDFAVIVGNIIKVFTGGAGFIALLMFVYGGFQWLTAAGNPEKIKKGRDILLWSILGIVVMFSSYIITNYLLRAILTGVVNP